MTMVQGQMWQCKDGLIDQALSTHPITSEVVVLNQHDGDFFYGTWTIKDEFKGTPWEEVLCSLPYTIGEARIITLKPGESYQSHADIDNRWHLNLTGEQSFLIDLDSKTMFKCERNNHWYYMQTDRVHTACNFGSIPRLQLVVREPLRKSRQPDNLTSVAIAVLHPSPESRYKFDNVFSPFLNRINYQYKMADFHPTETIVRFKMEDNLRDELNALTTTDFNITYD